MSWIDILDAGMLTTVQDLGRTGSQRYGVPVSGAMDTFALRAANRLVGNADGAAGLEMTVVGPEVRFGGDAVVAITGADLGPSLDLRPVAGWQSHLARAGAVLSFAGVRDGLRAYLAVAGGIDVPVVLGSRSTFTRSALGGFDGRALRAGDRLPMGPRPPGAEARRRLPRDAVPVYGHAHILRIVLGPQDDAFTEDGVATLLSADYAVTPQSDRIGCRLAGPRIAHRAGADIVSDGTAFGSVQVTGDGVPIILMADRGTTGGYTKIATVVRTDLARLAQATPGDRVRFVAADVGQAQALLREQEAVLARIVARASGPPPPSGGPVYDEDTGAALAADGYEDLATALERSPGAQPRHPRETRRQP